MCGTVFLVGCTDSQVTDETESKSVHEETMSEETEHPETESGRFTYSASRELDLYIDGYSNYMELAVERFTALHPEVTVTVTDCLPTSMRWR